jgi:hypothetical protein
VKNDVGWRGVVRDFTQEHEVKNDVGWRGVVRDFTQEHGGEK